MTGSSSGDLPVVFIAGVGRSGSTLLDLCLNGMDSVATVGELRFLWENGYRQNVLCGCGTPFRDCTVWRATMAHAFVHGPADLAAIERDKSAVDRWRHLPRLLFPTLRDGRFRERLCRYGDTLRRVIAAAAVVQNATVVVDSSKDPTHGLILAHTPGIDLRVVHLVRDPRAAVFSRSRLRRRPEIVDEIRYMPRQSTLESAFEWVLLNRLSERVAASARRSIRLRYDELTAAPSESLARLRAALDLPESGTPFIDDRRVRFSENHSIAGNPIRFQQGAITIESDEAWQSEMAPVDRRLVEMVTGRLASQYGFAS